jgi:methyltransferase
MLTRYIFIGIVVTVILQRLLELRLSKYHTAYLLAQGAKEHSDNLLNVVKILQISWWVAMIAEVWLLDRPFIPALGVAALIATLIGQILRYLSMQALKWHWTLSIMTISGDTTVNTGIYHFLRHPNWLGVILEIAALPLIHSAYLSAIVFSIANAILMSKRIQTEEQALSKDTNYASVFRDKPRFLPVLGLIGKTRSF